MKFITNMWDINGKYAFKNAEGHTFEERLENWNYLLEWIKDKTMDIPQATEKHSVVQLMSMGIVGIYVLNDDD